MFLLGLISCGEDKKSSSSSSSDSSRSEVSLGSGNINYFLTDEGKQGLCREIDCPFKKIYYRNSTQPHKLENYTGFAKSCEDGRVEVLKKYKNGVLVYKKTWWMSTGEPRHVRRYNDNGERDGIWKTYYENGFLSHQTEYENGREISTQSFSKRGLKND